MDRGASSLGAAALALAALWIVVYWWTPAAEPDPAPRVSFGAPPTTLPVFDPPPSRPAPSQPASPAAQRAADAAPRIAQPTPAPVAATADEPARPQFIEHTIEKGDSAERISARYYGTPRHWRSVMRANPLLDFTRLRPGRSLRVPNDPANVRGNESAESVAHTLSKQVDMEYTVRDGDTLSEIAKRVYGRSTLWHVLRDANRDVVDDDGLGLRAGQVLRIPPLPG